MVTPLSRTRRTAEAIFAAGYPPAALAVEPDLAEQHLGEWQGLVHADLPARLTLPKHAFWPLSGWERPPGGESMAEVILRAGAVLERLAATHAGDDVVAVSHGGSIRAAVAHALPDRSRQRAASGGAEPVAHQAGAAPRRVARGLRQRIAGLLITPASCEFRASC